MHQQSGIQQMWHTLKTQVSTEYHNENTSASSNIFLLRSSKDVHMIQV